MRAICEVCARPQPGDWKAGDLCIHCGNAVRREARCFWCTKWTPSSGKYCRACGAAVIDGRLFGAARMLKDAGVDRFGVPKMLVELDADQIDNYLQIYQRHATVMNRHVDHVRFLQTFLREKTWSEILEEELIGQLPWPDERLKALSPPLAAIEQPSAGMRSRAESLELARAISSITPFPLTRSLALLARLSLEDWEVHKEAQSVFYTQDPGLRSEAALVLTSWRVAFVRGIQSDRYALIEELRRSPFRLPATVQLAMLADKDTKLPVEALVSDDPDIAFSAALASSDVDRLTAATRDGDSTKRYVAASKLVKLGVLKGVDDVLRASPRELQLELLREIALRKKPVDELHDVLFEILESASDNDIRRSAGSALTYCYRTEDTLRLARAAKGDTSAYQRILQTPGMPAEEIERFCVFLLENGRFRAEQWGMPDIAKQGRMPASFVPRHWAEADDAARIEMCRFAEMQLEEYADEDLHRFVVHVVFGEASHAVQLQAWTCLYRWYGRSDHSGQGPLRIKTESLGRFFGSVEKFVPVLTRFLGNGTPPPILQELCVREPLAKFLRYSDADVLPHLVAEIRSTADLIAALKGVMQYRDGDLMVRLACIDLLVLFAHAPELQAAVQELLEGFRGSDLDHAASAGLERIR